MAALDDWAARRGEPPLVALMTELDTELEPHFQGRARTALLGFARLMADLSAASRERTPDELLDQVLARTNYRAALEKGDRSDERWENVLGLRNAVSEYTELEPPTGLLAFLEGTALHADLDTLRDDRDAVTLMTLHSAKGLEYPVVFITGMEEDLLPYYRSKENLASLEEERRLCYVGITRAMERLYLLHARQRALWGTPREADPSRFLKAVPEGSAKEVKTDVVGILSGERRRPAASAAVRPWSGRVSSTGWTPASRASAPAQSGSPPATRPASGDPDWRRLGIRSAAELSQQPAGDGPPHL